MLDGLSAGLLSFLVDGARTMIVAGTRSSGKTSLLGSLMLEIMPRYRIISVEDTLELPINELRKLDYDVLFEEGVVGYLAPEECLDLFDEIYNLPEQKLLAYEDYDGL
jgi:type IV secretory pathway ATPase VirB11/archaellum biosynthesis ATPase